MNDEELSQSEREEISQNIEDEGEGIGARTIFVAYGIMLLILFIFVPKIYVANNVYYASRNIAFLQDQRDALKNENSELQRKLEEMKFGFLTLEIEEIK